MIFRKGGPQNFRRTGGRGGGARGGGRGRGRGRGGVGRGGLGHAGSLGPPTNDADDGDDADDADDGDDGDDGDDAVTGRAQSLGPPTNGVAAGGGRSQSLRPSGGNGTDAVRAIAPRGRSVGAHGAPSGAARAGRGMQRGFGVYAARGGHQSAPLPNNPPRHPGMSNEIRSTLADQDMQWVDQTKRRKRDSDQRHRDIGIEPTPAPSDEGRDIGVMDDIEQAGNVQCSICQLVLNRPVQLKCQHAACSDCMATFIGSQGRSKLTCPLCKAPFHSNDVPLGMLTLTIVIDSMPAWCPHGRNRAERREAGDVWNGLHVAASAPVGEAGASAGGATLKKKKKKGGKSQRTADDDDFSDEEKVRTPHPIFANTA